jgi:large subunit ribosomal protein L18e
MKPTGPTNRYLRELINKLKKLSNKEKVKIWKVIALELGKPTRKRVNVNISKINKYTKDNETAIIPGKVLSSGELTKKITIAAYQFSKTAKEKLGNNAILIKELIKVNPKGKRVRIIK